MTVTAGTHRALLACRDHIDRTLAVAMEGRDQNPTWIEDERHAVVSAANTWVTLSGHGRRITIDDVLAVEPRAIGHSDYRTKLSLYVAEVVLDLNPGARRANRD